MKSLRSFALVFAGVSASCVALAQEAAPQTTVGVGLEVIEGKYGATQKTTTLSVPLSVKHERGPWSFRASLPFVSAEGSFSTEAGFTTRRSGTEIVPCDPTEGDVCGGGAGKRRESGLGDLTLGVFYNVLATKGGFSVDVGAKAKLATADKAKTLITSGENDYSVQTDLMQSAGAVSLFGSLGVTKKGDSAGVDYSDPVYGSLGASIDMGGGGSLGASWDFREKTTAFGDPVSEVTAFYNFKTSPANKVQIYVVTGLSDGSPDAGGGVLFSHRY